MEPEDRAGPRDSPKSLSIVSSVIARSVAKESTLLSSVVGPCSAIQSTS